MIWYPGPCKACDVGGMLTGNACHANCKTIRNANVFSSKLCSKEVFFGL